ncbi:MAG: hypothetical protein LCI00_15950 [Chloroflexi bacterium]|nr:hypothetical protein [Chloroflexota bacterium]MCC6892724.1 hypothetical protein [Anaerolineae bacterium]
MNPNTLPELPNSNTNDEAEDEAIFENPAEGFKQGWRDMLEGNIIPASQLLNALNEEP